MKIRCIVPSYNIDEIIEVSDTAGFDKSSFYGWYIEEPINGEVHNYFHHSNTYYNNDMLDEFDETKCRIITEFKALKIKKEIKFDKTAWLKEFNKQKK